MYKSIFKKAGHFPGIKGPARYLNRYRPAILMYHGLSNNDDIRDWTQVRPSDFKRQMLCAKQNYNIVSLKNLVEMLQSGKIEPHSVAVTFDDGYRSNYDLAYPILKDLNIPATIFVAGGFVSQSGPANRYLWPDFIGIVLKSHAGKEIDLTDIGLDRFDISTGEKKRTAQTIICERFKSIKSSEKDSIIKSLEEKFGDTIRHEEFSDYLPMTPDHIRQISEEGLVTIGAHTRNHSILSQLDPQYLEDEIIGCKNDLEKIIDRKITEFAYPNGRLVDIGPEALAITSRTYLCAVTTEAGLNGRLQNKYLLRRIGIGSYYGLDEFKVLLSGVFYLWQTPLRDL
jgi:peptidoglycan/xylan/chitin deacetylase (PgdA/CDA1 family)